MIHATGKVLSAARSTPARGSETSPIASAIRRIRPLGPIGSPVKPWTFALVCNIRRHLQVTALTQKLSPGPLQTQTPCSASTGICSENLPRKPEPTRKTNRNTRKNPAKSAKIRVNPGESGQKMKIKKKSEIFCLPSFSALTLARSAK